MKISLRAYMYEVKRILKCIFYNNHLIVMIVYKTSYKSSKKCNEKDLDILLGIIMISNSYTNGNHYIVDYCRLAK